MLRSLLVTLGIVSSVSAFAETYHFSRVSQDPTLKQIAVCNTGKIYGLFADGTIRSSMTGAAGSFRVERVARVGALQNIACGGDTLYYLTTGRQLYWINRGSAVNSGHPYAAAEIAVGQDYGDEFPIIFALNDDRSLYRSGSMGSDASWQYKGSPLSAHKIAALNTYSLLAINDDGALYVNRASGTDSAWVQQSVCNADLRNTVSVGTSDSGRNFFVLLSDGSLLRGAVGNTFCNVFPIPRPIPYPLPRPIPLPHPVPTPH